VLWLLTLLLLRPGLLAVVLAAWQASAGQAGSLPPRATARLAAVTLPLARAALVPAGLRLMTSLAPGSLASGSLASGPLTAGRWVPPARRLRGWSDRGRRVVPVLPVLAGAAGLVLAGLLVLAGDERLGLLGQLGLRLGAARGHPVGAAVRLGQRRT
jgi:hypothetical protein